MDPKETLAHLAAIGTPPDDEDVLLRLSAGLTQSLKRIDSEILPFVAGGGGELQFIFGPYGRGKTHYLKTIARWARQRGFVTAYVDCESPFASLSDTYTAIANAMSPPVPGNFVGATGITRVVESRFAERDTAEQRDLIERLKADRALSPDFRNLVVAYCTESIAGGGDEYLSERIEALLANIRTYRVTPSSLYREHPRLPRPLGKIGRRNAALWLRSILSLPRILGYGGLLLLFDETESSLRNRSHRQRQTHLAHIRTFVDHMATGAFRGCAVYYAVTEEFIDIADTHLKALSQRIERVRVPDMGDSRNPRAVWVDIDELTEPGSDDPRFYEELGSRIIDIGRTAGLSRSKASSLMDELVPVAKEYAEAISEGRVRDFVRLTAESVANNI